MCACYLCVVLSPGVKSIILLWSVGIANKNPFPLSRYSRPEIKLQVAGRSKFKQAGQHSTHTMGFWGLIQSEQSNSTMAFRDEYWPGTISKSNIALPGPVRLESLRLIPEL